MSCAGGNEYTLLPPLPTQPIILGIISCDLNFSPGYQTDPTEADKELFYQHLNLGDTRDLYFLFTVAPNKRSEYIMYKADEVVNEKGEIEKKPKGHTLESVQGTIEEEELSLKSSIFPWGRGMAGQADNYKLLLTSRNWHCEDEQLAVPPERVMQQSDLLGYRWLWDFVASEVQAVVGRTIVKVHRARRRRGGVLSGIEKPRLDDPVVIDELHRIKIKKWIETVETILQRGKKISIMSQEPFPQWENGTINLPPIQCILYANCSLVINVEEQKRIAIEKTIAKVISNYNTKKMARIGSNENEGFYFDKMVVEIKEIFVQEEEGGEIKSINEGQVTGKTLRSPSADDDDDDCTAARKSKKRGGKKKKRRRKKKTRRKRRKTKKRRRKKKTRRKRRKTKKRRIKGIRTRKA